MIFLRSVVTAADSWLAQLWTRLLALAHAAEGGILDPPGQGSEVPPPLLSLSSVETSVLGICPMSSFPFFLTNGTLA